MIEVVLLSPLQQLHSSLPISQVKIAGINQLTPLNWFTDARSTVWASTQALLHARPDSWAHRPTGRLKMTLNTETRQDISDTMEQTWCDAAVRSIHAAIPQQTGWGSCVCASLSFCAWQHVNWVDRVSAPWCGNWAPNNTSIMRNFRKVCILILCWWRFSVI